MVVVLRMVMRMIYDDSDYVHDDNGDCDAVTDEYDGDNGNYDVYGYGDAHRKQHHNLNNPYNGFGYLQICKCLHTQCRQALYNMPYTYTRRFTMRALCT